MSSINTNVSAMQALQSLNKTNEALETTQQRISTGYKVGNAKDNAAMWSVAQVMRSDVSGFNAISEQLSLGESTVAVARNASETVSELTEQIKERVVSAQGDNVDRQKIQNDIDELVGQVKSVVDAAQFNGTNLLKDATGGESFDVISSLDRDSDQNVTTSRISVDQVNLDTTTNVVTGQDVSAGTIDINNTNLAASGGISEMHVTVDGVDFKIDVSGQTSAADIATAMNSTTQDGVTLTATEAGGQITFAGGTVEGISARGAGVGLSSLDSIDVAANDGLSVGHALSAMEGFTQDAIDAAANFGSAQMRIETQMDFVGKLSDSLEAGVGSLVDANMTEESAKLNALQVQQQLGTQALSIANQSPQALLSLFR